jgi:type I restriction enzyme S subunit
MMKAEWHKIAFREFLTPNLRPIDLRPDQDANLVGMRWYGEGPFHRELKVATKIAKKSHFVIHAGDVIYNKLFAWKGTFGIVSQDLDQMFVSDKFPTYTLDESKVSAGYLRWYFRNPELWEQARIKSTGSAAISRLTLNPPKFLDLSIVAPRELTEQNRIAEILDSLAMKRDEVRQIKASALSETQVLTQVVISDLVKSLNRSGRLADVLTGPPRNGWSVKCDNAEGGTAVLALGAVTGFTFKPDAIKFTSEPTQPGAPYWLTPGDLLLTRSNTLELVGHAALYDGQVSPCIYPDLMMLLPVDEQLGDKRFVWYWLQTTPIRQFIRLKAKGTSPTMKKISQPIVNSIPFPSNLSLEEQRRFVDLIDDQLTLVKRMQQAYGTWESELEGIVPGMLSKAFEGLL